MTETRANNQITRITPLSELPEFLSPEEVRIFLLLGRATCYELLRRGTIPSIRFGRCIRVPKAALAALSDNVVGDAEPAKSEPSEAAVASNADVIASPTPGAQERDGARS